MNDTLKLRTYQQLLNYLDNNHNYLIFRGFDLPITCANHDIDILIEAGEKAPNIIFPRKTHFQYDEVHKGIYFVSQNSLNKKVWNGRYWTLCKIDKLRMNILRFIKKIYGNFLGKLYRDSQNKHNASEDVRR